jgi:hypothetical protein
LNSAHERIISRDQARGRTFLSPGWLPPEAECPELADLRAEHLRLLSAVDQALTKLSAMRVAAESAESRRSDAVREAIRAGKDASRVKVTAPDTLAIERAGRDYESAGEALELFVQDALREIEQTAPAIEAALAERISAAAAKRAEARCLLAEADRLAADPKRLQSWLDRYVSVTDNFSGESRKRNALGPIAFDATDVPLPTPVPDVISEIAGLGPAEVLGVGSDELLPEETEALNVH